MVSMRETGAKMLKKIHWGAIETEPTDLFSGMALDIRLFRGPGRRGELWWVGLILQLF